MLPKGLEFGKAVIELDALEHVAGEVRPLQVQLEERGPARGRERRPRLESEVLDVEVPQGRALRRQGHHVRAGEQGLSPGPE